MPTYLSKYRTWGQVRQACYSITTCACTWSASMERHTEPDSGAIRVERTRHGSCIVRAWPFHVLLSNHPSCLPWQLHAMSWWDTTIAASRRIGTAQRPARLHIVRTINATPSMLTYLVGLLAITT